jgi:hypothetical protein
MNIGPRYSSVSPHTRLPQLRKYETDKILFRNKSIEQTHIYIFTDKTLINHIKLKNKISSHFLNNLLLIKKVESHSLNKNIRTKIKYGKIRR